MSAELYLHNSISGKLEKFVPIDEKNVRLYACGPTVYSTPHIGNARPIVVFDVLFRLLRKLYKNVTYVRNITDVDDKINARARRENISIRELTTKVAEDFHKSINHLNVLSPTHEPRATEHISEILEIIKKLIENDFAYESQGHVLFRVKRMKNYGMLSKRNLEDMIAGARVEVAPYKEDPLDFVLWKPSDENTPSWPSPYGLGRPGWHIECSAMSHKYLGNQFDIHAGGQDLMFPHHENEIAQNFGAFDCLMANYWLHNGMILINGEKMSKSLNNIIALNDMLEKYPGEVLRYVFLSAHYQKTLNWTEEIIQQSYQSLNRLYGALKLASGVSKKIEISDSNVTNALCNNLNTPLAISHLHELADKIYKSKNQSEIDQLCDELVSEAEILGILHRDCHDWFKQSKIEISEEKILQLIKERAEAKSQKNFKRADEIRAELQNAGVRLEDGPNGTTWKTI